MKVVWRPGLLALADGSVFEGEVLAEPRLGPARPVPPPGRSSSTQ